MQIIAVLIVFVAVCIFGIGFMFIRWRRAGLRRFINDGQRFLFEVSELNRAVNAFLFTAPAYGVILIGLSITGYGTVWGYRYLNELWCLAAVSGVVLVLFFVWLHHRDAGEASVDERQFV